MVVVRGAMDGDKVGAAVEKGAAVGRLVGDAVAVQGWPKRLVQVPPADWQVRVPLEKPILRVEEQVEKQLELIADPPPTPNVLLHVLH